MTVVAFAHAFRMAEASHGSARVLGGAAAFGQIVAERIPFGRVDAAEWDRFAAAADASFQSGFDYLRAQALKGLGRWRYAFYDIWLINGAGREKIGQCAVASRRGRHRIQDRIHLPPEHAAHWGRALSALLHTLGAGHYQYGGLWSCEASREGELRALPHVTVDYARPFAVQGVAFGQWPSWDRYWAKVSDSVRYEAKYAPERVAGLELKTFRGLSMLRAIPAIVTLQGASYARKRLRFVGLKQSLRHAYYMLLSRRSLEVVLAEGDAGVLAAFYGTQLGGNMHYIFGGQRAGSGGANWYLLKEMARKAYEAAPSGRFVMGNVDYAVHDETKGGGLLRARRALRVTDHETAMIDFRYQPRRAPAVTGHVSRAFSHSFAFGEKLALAA